MSKEKNKRDYLRLPDSYRQFHDEAVRLIDGSRLLIDPFRTLAYGTDASFYRLIPKIVVRVCTVEEVTAVLKISRRLKVPVTFRAAGTSLSGQAVTDSVLLLLAGAWRGLRIHDDGERITLEPGVIGAEANAALGPYGRRIGPDPASINSCMIGGIAANNASGMCCGIAQNSYQTVERMKILLGDGAMLDTGDPGSRRRFRESHGPLLKEIELIRDEIHADAALTRRIRHKYAIKNTTGYSLNAFIDHTDPIDIFLRLMIGSEGTLGFNAEITYRTVPEHPHKASSLIVFPDLEQACHATVVLKKEPVAAAELMDRASLRSVESRKGMPPFLASLPGEAAALLVETRAADRATLGGQQKRIERALASIPSLFPVVFTDDKEECDRLWDVRRGLFPAVGGARKIGTTVIIEDVAFPMGKLAAATRELEGLMRKHGYDEGIIFGHALDGNLHFVFTQDFGDPGEVRRYQRLMDEVTDMVARKYDGSLKGEHGTGRNMAPFVELEWGAKAYSLMKRIKQAFDPEQLLNPGVIINEDPHVHLENLKPLPRTHELVDKCIECGFCEVKCPSRNLTTTPRQRITVRREISRLREAAVDGGMLERLENDYAYLGEQTCAADGLCATACPVSINTGDLTKHLRSEGTTPRGRWTAQWISNHYSLAASALRTSLTTAGLARGLFGAPLLGRISRGLRVLSGNRIPQWNGQLPSAAPTLRFRDSAGGSGPKVVYFPSCIARTMGPARGDRDQRQVFEAMLSVLEKADYDVLFPDRLADLCCGMPFESKGFFDQAGQKVRELEAALLERSDGGKHPILCDTSPCLERMRRSFAPGLKLYEPVEFIHAFLLGRLQFNRTPETVAVHVTCSSVKMGLQGAFRAVAEACADQVVIPPAVGCCGFAGDRGFTHPELNRAALAELGKSLPSACRSGFSNSRTCEIGLSLHGGRAYQSIVYLVDRCTERMPPGMNATRSAGKAII